MIAQRIAELRKRRGMSQGQLAKVLSVSASTEGMYEQGRRTPSIDTLITMSQIFGVSLDYLITGAEFSLGRSASKWEQIAVDCPCRSCYWKKEVVKNIK